MYLLVCVAMPSVIAARWVGRNSGPVFSVCRPHVHQIKYARAGVIAVCNEVFCLTNCVSFQRYSPSTCDIAEILMFWAAIFFGGKRGGISKFLTEFYKSGSPLNMWQSLVMIGRATSEIRWRKKKIINTSNKT